MPLEAISVAMAAFLLATETSSRGYRVAGRHFVDFGDDRRVPIGLLCHRLNTKGQSNFRIRVSVDPTDCHNS